MTSSSHQAKMPSGIGYKVWHLNNVSNFGPFQPHWLVNIVSYGGARLCMCWKISDIKHIDAICFQVSGLYSGCSYWLLSSISWEADWRKGSSRRPRCCSGSYLWSDSPRAEIAAQLWCSKSPYKPATMKHKHFWSQCASTFHMTCLVVCRVTPLCSWRVLWRCII